MAAWREYRFDYIAPNAGASVFIHGYSHTQAVSYSAVVHPGSGPGVLNPKGHINMTQGEAFRHVDGTDARLLKVQNLAPFNSCTVDILILSESF
jgi:hypothetical protein